ncbi:uncharacterized protein LOC119104685 [Pollicipes pollicipes]|uniref:uncharacterized protein LOC119104685 n=1 Tax=Pollicipes pollicipes TaxID=41117 RepID=UPI00188546CE|nr:uncharacterized protein LOC119104685 [Pollicipes pollicipes]
MGFSQIMVIFLLQYLIATVAPASVPSHEPYPSPDFIKAMRPETVPHTTTETTTNSDPHVLVKAAAPTVLPPNARELEFNFAAAPGGGVTVTVTAPPSLLADCPLLEMRSLEDQATSRRLPRSRSRSTLFPLMPSGDYSARLICDCVTDAVPRDASRLDCAVSWRSAPAGGSKFVAVHGVDMEAWQVSIGHSQLPSGPAGPALAVSVVQARRAFRAAARVARWLHGRLSGRRLAEAGGRRDAAARRQLHAALRQSDPAGGGAGRLVLLGEHGSLSIGDLHDSRPAEADVDNRGGGRPPPPRWPPVALPPCRPAADRRRLRRRRRRRRHARTPTTAARRGRGARRRRTRQHRFRQPSTGEAARAFVTEVRCLTASRWAAEYGRVYQARLGADAPALAGLVPGVVYTLPEHMTELVEALARSTPPPPGDGKAESRGGDV